MAELFQSDIAQERGLKMTIKSPDGREVDFIKSPLSETRATYPPRVGQHSMEILRDVLGLEDREIMSLQDQGIVRSDAV
jgi:crotonobetainyl-CoA:carnitine CoA-transferase CaiB-like acyl-CoA transferase